MELKTLNLKELQLDEQQKINGGFFWIPVAIAVVIAVINDWDNFKRGIAGKPELPK